uniref:MFS domain-containing protein n=1 Tax=Parastrongyloides trichosuri TaxID=131310 RepID=A0A0N5A5R8_PARTI
MVLKIYFPQWVNPFNILIFFLWQSTIFFGVQNIFSIFTHYIPNWRCKNIGDYGNNCTIFTSGCEIEYENEYFASVPIKFELVCNNNSYFNAFQSQFQFFGVLLGTVAFGYLSDKYGRRSSSIVNMGLGCLTIIISAFVNDSETYVSTRFFLGFFTGGALNSSLTYASEVLPPKQRLFVKCCFNWGLSRLIMTLICYFFNDYTSALFISGIILLPSVFLLIFYFPESPTWYHYKNKVELLVKSERKIAKLSHLPYRPSSNLIIPNKVSFLTLLQDKTIFKRLSALWCIWFITSLCSYAIDLNSNTISGNLYINQFFFGFTIFISKLIVPYIDTKYKWFTRRSFHQGAQIVVVLCFAMLALLVSVKHDSVAILILNLIGIVFIEFCWDACYLSSIESMPTNVRCSSFASCSLMARVGAIFSPVLPLLNNYWSPTMYLIVAGLGIVNFIVSYFFLIETKNINLDNVFVDEAFQTEMDTFTELLDTK